MTHSAFPTQELLEVAQSMYDFEAGASRPNTGTGSRREGHKFEALGGDLWDALAEYVSGRREATRTRLRGPSNSAWNRLDVGSRTLYLPSRFDAKRLVLSADSRWLSRRYAVENLIAAFPGAQQAVDRYSPDAGPYSGESYPGMWEKRETKFDGAIILVEDGVLREKILLEYKTAKSSKAGISLEGNVHERLSFQILQYLEVACRYSACSFTIMVNGAFTKYRNKYHPNFHIQADRLRVFRWFEMEYLSTVAEYGRFVSGLCDWLLYGRPRRDLEGCR